MRSMASFFMVRGSTLGKSDVVPADAAIIGTRPNTTKMTIPFSLSSLEL